MRFFGDGNAEEERIGLRKDISLGSCTPKIDGNETSWKIPF